MNLFVQGLRRGIELLYLLFGDYGVAIVLVTMGIRILLIPLNIYQRKQMKKQQEMSRRVEELKLKYEKNPKKLEGELSRLYREQGMSGAGCLLTFLQFPIMMCLYEGIRLTAAAGTATILLPWVSSLLVRDKTFILPAATLAVQLLPQIYPYLGFFRSLHLQKMSVPMLLTLLLTNSVFAFMIPSGVGLYYFVSGAFSAAEQFALHCLERKRAAQAA